MNVLDEIVQDQLRTDLPELASGDTVKVSAKVVEGNRERIQVFEGTVMRLRGGGITRSITVRRIASRRRRRADVQDQQPAHREDRGRPPRRGPPRPAVLPAQPRRQGRDPARAPHQRLSRAARPPAVAPSRPRRSGGVARFRYGYPAPMAVHRPDPPLRAPPLERRARPRRRRGRGRRRADLRRGRRGGRDHAARLPPDPRRPRLEDAVGGPARTARAADPGARRGGRRRAPRRSARSTSSTSTTPRTSRCAGRSPGSAATSTSSSTATGSPGFEAQVGPYTNDRRRRRQGLLDRLRVGRRQGRPRPDDDRARRPLSGLRLGAQPGLRDAASTARRSGALGLTPFHRRSFLALQRTLAGDQLGLFDDPEALSDELTDEMATTCRPDLGRRSMAGPVAPTSSVRGREAGRDHRLRPGPRRCHGHPAGRPDAGPAGHHDGPRQRLAREHDDERAEDRRVRRA